MNDKARIALDMKLYQESWWGLSTREFARYVMEICEKFDEVTLNFTGVEEIAEEFADEIFRVWHGQHPGTWIVVHNASRDVVRRISAAAVDKSLMLIYDDVSTPDFKELLDSVLGRNK